MRTLVTGGAGFIGSNLAKHLAASGQQAVVADDFSSAGWKTLVEFPSDVLTVDVAGDVSLLEKAGPFDVIFHQASITDTTVMDQRKMMHNNVEGFRQLLDLAVRWGSRVVWASSASLYGQGAPPMREAQPPQPLNVYAFSKLAMERLARQYAPLLKQPIVGLRYFNVYGPGETHKGKFASMIHQLAKQMRAGKRPRIFFSGEQKRDFVYVGDVVQANLQALKATSSGVFNVGCGQPFSFNQVVTELNKVFKSDLPPDYFENPYDFTQDWTEADLTESRKVLGYQPQFPPPLGIAEYFRSGQLGV